MRLKQFSLLLNQELTSQEVSLIDEIFLEKKYYSKPSFEDIKNYNLFFIKCLKQNKKKGYYDSLGLKVFFSVTIINLFFSQQRINLKLLIWLIKNNFLKYYLHQFTLRDFFYVVRRAYT